MSNKEITVFTEGDSSDSSVWSNVPYFLTRTLEQKGYLVHRINVEGSPLLKAFYDKFLCRIIRHFFVKGTSFTYNRSLFYHLETNFRMKQTVKKYPNSASFISTSFSFSPAAYTEKPAVLFCDWTYDYYISHFLQRSPDFLEKPEIKRQNAIIEQATCIFVLFPNVAQYMRSFYHNNNIHYLGNVINSDPFTNTPDSIQAKQQNKNVLFIGLKKYKDGAEALINAVTNIHPSYPDITLDMIGMDTQDFDNKLPPYIHCHGYLSKDKPAEKDLYYSLMNNATVYVNTTPIWAGFSSALESLYHYLPVITTNYPSFTDTFGNYINFGYYCNENSPTLIASFIKDIFSLMPAQYLDMCSTAHHSVMDFTWSSYVDKLIGSLHGFD